MWEYRCRVLSFYDGDSLDLEVDLGFGVTIKLDDPGTRLYRVDTPEIRGVERPEGLKAKQFVAEWLQSYEEDSEWPFICRTAKDDTTGKYGRYLVDLIPRLDTEAPTLVESIKEAGHDTEDWKGW